MGFSYQDVYDHHSKLNIDPWWWIENALSLAEGTRLTEEDIEKAYLVLGSEPHGEWHLLDADTGDIVSRSDWDEWLLKNGITEFDEACDETTFDLIISYTGSTVTLSDILWALCQ